MPQPTRSKSSKRARSATKASSRKAPEPKLTASAADKRLLYEKSVQFPEGEIDFVDRWFEKLRGRKASLLREDFCASAASACEWVRRRSTNRAIGLDLDPKILKWGQKHTLAKLNEDERSRVTLLQRDVLNPGPGTDGVDIVSSMNFSYFAFKTRSQLLSYFSSVRASLANDGVYFLDALGGWESMKVQQERRKIEGKFTYVWDQAYFDPISHDLRCHIHFEFPDGTKIQKAFTYHWRLWNLPDITELLRDAGFTRVTVYWEGDDGKGGGNGQFRPVKRGEDGPSFIVYITAER